MTSTTDRVLEHPDSDRLSLDEFLDALGNCDPATYASIADKSTALTRVLTRLHAAAGELRRTRSQLLIEREQIRELYDALDKQETRINDLENLHCTSTRELEAVTAAKSRFLATMSHELRTPMNAVLGMADLLHDTQLSPQQLEFVDTIRTSGTLLLTIVNDILDISKLQARRVELECLPIDLCDVISNAFSLVRESAARKRLELSYELTPGTPMTIRGDGFRLQQVLVNLLSNAVKFTDEGEVILTVDSTSTATDDALTLQFHVRDTGIGIPVDRQARLFTAFSQVDASTTRRYGGTGLGLAIAKELVEMMNGRISVTSEQGKGATFAFSIQVTPDEPAATHDIDSDVLTGKRLLIVDDHASSRRILCDLTRRWNMATHHAASGPKALERLICDEPFDAVIVDLLMPDMDGILLARTMRQLDALRQVPLLLMNSLGLLSDTAANELFAAVLHKPIHPQRLRAALDGLFDADPSLDVTSVSSSGAMTGDNARADAMASRHPLRILVAEDNVINQRVTMSMLRRFGYRPDIVNNGVEAVEAARQRIYDLIFLDVQMPEMDGLTAARVIRRAFSSADDDSQRPRIVALSAGTTSDQREQCLAVGMDEFISKPFNREVIQQVLRASKRLDAGIETRAQPASTARTTSSRTPTAPPQRITSEHVVTGQFSRSLSVLVAEDHVINQRVVRLALRKMGFHCTIVSNGREAVDAVATDDYDLVLMDCQMPVMDGYRATEKIRSTDKGRHLPIIAFTTYSSADDRIKCLAVGMDGHVSKPLDRRLFVAEIRRILAARDKASRSTLLDHGEMSPGSSPILDRLHELSGGDRAAATEVIELFCSSSEKLVHDMRAAVTQADRESLVRLCHELLGVSESIGAEHVALWARTLQTEATGAGLDRLASYVSRLEQALKDAQGALQRLSLSGATG